MTSPEYERDQQAILAAAQRDPWAGDPDAAERVRRGAQPMADFAADLSAEPDEDRTDDVIVAGATGNDAARDLHRSSGKSHPGRQIG